MIASPVTFHRQYGAIAILARNRGDDCRWHGDGKGAPMRAPLQRFGRPSLFAKPRQTRRTKGRRKAIRSILGLEGYAMCRARQATGRSNATFHASRVHSWPGARVHTGTSVARTTDPDQATRETRQVAVDTGRYYGRQGWPPPQRGRVTRCGTAVRPGRQGTTADRLSRAWRARRLFDSRRPVGGLIE